MLLLLFTGSANSPTQLPLGMPSPEDVWEVSYTLTYTLDKVELRSSKNVMILSNTNLELDHMDVFKQDERNFTPLNSIIREELNTKLTKVTKITHQ